MRKLIPSFVAVLLVVAFLWPFHKKKPEPALSSIGTFVYPEDCIVDKGVYYYVGKDGAVGVSKVDCVHAVNDWVTTPVYRQQPLPKV